MASMGREAISGQRFCHVVNRHVVNLRRANVAFGARIGFATILLALLLSTSTFADSTGDTYKSRCAPCHGAHGAGDTVLGRNLKLRPLGSDEVQKQSDDELFTIISKGKGRMPSFDRRLSKDQIRDLVNYIRALKK